MAPHNCKYFNTQSKNITEYWYFHFQPPVIESATNQNCNFCITFTYSKTVSAYRMGACVSLTNV